VTSNLECKEEIDRTWGKTGLIHEWGNIFSAIGKSDTLVYCMIANLIDKQHGVHPCTVRVSNSCHLQQRHSCSLNLGKVEDFLEELMM